MKKFSIIIISLTILMMSGICFAGDAELYQLVNGKSFHLTANKIEYTLKFAGFEDVEMSGTAYLMWPDNVILDGYRYQIQRKLILPFSVWNNSVGIDVADNDNVTTFDFIIDYEGSLVQACPDLRFYPVAIGAEE